MCILVTEASKRINNFVKSFFKARIVMRDQGKALGVHNRSAGGQTHLVIPTTSIVLEFDIAKIFDVFEEFSECSVTVVSLLKSRLHPPNGLLDQRAPEGIIIGLQRTNNLYDPEDSFHPLVQILLLFHLPRPCVALFFRLPGSLLLWSRARFFGRRFDEIVVIDELVAIGDEELRRRALDATANHAFIVFLELGNQWREIAVPGDESKEVNILLGVTKIDGVNDHSNVSRVLSAYLALRNID